MKLLTGQKIWERITHLASSTGQAWVAVPYFGKGAAKMLPLSAGSILVTRFERSAIRAGQVCPDDVIELLKRGVMVFNQPSLHAKIYAFRKVVILGSSNASHTSRDRLVEACIETDDPKIQNDAVALVLSLARDEVNMESAKVMQKEYREPVGFPLAAEKEKGKKRQSVRADELSDRPLWLVAMYELKTFRDVYSQALDTAMTLAEEAVAFDGESTVDVMLCREDERERLEVGDMVLIRDRDSATQKDVLHPPAKILAIRKVRGRNEFAVAYSQRKGTRKRQTSAVLERLGDRVCGLMNLKRAIRPAAPDERDALLGLWAVKAKQNSKGKK